ncbi:MAG: family 10 glycosylhydrolase [Bacteroidales bacterium]|nr:family 10 glycosylhydrolase [Bacteroidales bacterium]
MKKLTTSILLLTATGLSLFAQNPKREMRAAWLHTVNFSTWVSEVRVPACNGSNEAEREAARTIQKNAIIAYFDTFKAANLNAVFFHVRTTCDAFYKSKYEPWSHFLSTERGADPGWDPLEFAIEEAHKRGMELHAWLNPYRISFGEAQSVAATSPTDYVNTHPEWVLAYNDHVKILNPGLPEVTERIADVVEDIITRYNVDGITLDDYFYADNQRGLDNRPGKYFYLDTALYIAYKAENPNSQLSQGDWRRENCNKMVKAIYDRIQSIKPYVIFGMSPAGVAKGGAAALGIEPPAVRAGDWQYEQIYCNPLAWLVDGSVDYISPQIYWTTTHETAPYGPLSKWWSQVCKMYNVYFYPSHSFNTSPEEIGIQIDLNREYDELNAPGVVVWSGQNLLRGGHVPYLAGNQFKYKALPPAVHWKQADEQGMVDNLTLSGQTLSWTYGKENVRYAVYAIPSSQINDTEAFSNPEYLLGISYGKQFTLPAEIIATHHIAVSVLDRYGNESLPARTKSWATSAL